VAEISLRPVLEAAAELDSSGGASLALVAWELCVEEHEVGAAWELAIADALLKPAGQDALHGEQRWRLTAGGCAAFAGLAITGQPFTPNWARAGPDHDGVRPP
jgi:hypothetical protein